MTKKKYTVKLRIDMKLAQLYGIIRLCLVPMKYGKSWMCFMVQPALNLSIVPIIGEQDFNVANIPHVV